MRAGVTAKQDSLIYNFTGQQVDWAGKAIRAIFTRKMKARADTLYKDFGTSVKGTFTEKLKALGICETQ